MRNLKRALSLALAAIMLVGMMVVGASAVSYNDFSDREEIVNKDAVSMLVTLGVIDGKPDGSFAPTEGVDRAQMAKMISVIMNQGVDNGALYENSPSGLTDISTSWAKGHINFCYTTGIIAGRGNGKFDPSAGVTGSEAAKMLLVAAGYDPAIEGLTGADWEINTNALASKLGIFRNFKAPVGDPLTRDNAALLIYNALDVEMIESYTNNGYPMAFGDSRTILSYMYGVYKVEGVVVANEWAQLEQTDSDAALRTGRTTLDNVKLYGSTTANTTKGENYEEIKGTVSFDVTTPVDMIGKTVTMYIEKTTILSNSKVLGVGTKDDVNVINGTTANSDTLSKFLKGTGVAVSKDTEYYVNYGYCKDETVARELINDYVADAKSDKFNLNGVEVEVIDNNNDGTADYVLYTQETLSEVKSYSEKNETISFWTPTYDKDGKLTNKATSTSEDFADVVFADEVTTNDLILYVQYGGRTYISLPEIVTGTMTRVDRDKANELYITVEGETYKQSYILDAATLVDVDLTRFAIENAKDEPGFDNKYDFVLDSNGYVIAIRPAEETVANYALVLNSAWTQNALDYSGQVKVLMADGTVDTFKINWDNSAKAFKNVAVDVDLDGVVDIAADKNEKADLSHKLEGYLGTRDVVGGKDTGAAKGTIITYTLSDDDVLTIKSVLQGNNLKAGTNDIDNSKNTATTAGVGDNGTIAYMNNADDHSLQYAVAADYKSGRGSLSVWAYGASKATTYAIDKNTLAFYYDGTDYHVATGWDNMGDVDANTEVQVYPVLNKTAYKTYEASSLAGVVLFETVPEVTSANYMLVLDANAIGKDLLELNVVFEDGKSATIKVDDDGGYAWDKKDGDAYMKAYNYSENADGTYDIGDKVLGVNTAELLKNGTVELKDFYTGYHAVDGKAQLWDVTDVTKGGDDVALGKFSYNTPVYAVVVLNSDDSIRTAWVWDIPAEEKPEKPVKPGMSVEVDGNGNITVVNGAEATTEELANAIVKELESRGYSDVKVTVKAGVVESVEATKNNITTTFNIPTFEKFADLADQPADREDFVDRFAGYTGDEAGFQKWGYLPTPGLSQAVGADDVIYVSGKLDDVLAQIKAGDKDVLAGLNYQYFSGIETAEDLVEAIKAFGFTAVEKVGFVGLNMNGEDAVSCVVEGTVNGKDGVYTLKHATEGNTNTTFNWAVDKSTTVTVDISGLYF